MPPIMPPNNFSIPPPPISADVDMNMPQENMSPIAPVDMGGAMPQMTPPPVPSFNEYQQDKQAKAPSQEDGWLKNVGSYFRNMPAFETIRQAARTDPATFYSILSNVALLNPGGIQQTINERGALLRQQEEQRQLQGYRQQQLRQDMEMKKLEVTRQRGEDDDKYVDRVRSRATMDGVLGEFEDQYGIVNDRTSAETLERWVSDKRGNEKRKKDGLGILKLQAKTPTLKLTGPAKEMYDNDPQFAAVWDAQKEYAEEKKVKLTEKQDLDYKLTTARLTQLNQALASSGGSGISAAQKYDYLRLGARLNDVHSNIQRLERQVAENELYLGSGFLNADMEASMQADQAELEEAKKEYDAIDLQLQRLIAAMDMGVLVQAPGVDSKGVVNPPPEKSSTKSTPSIEEGETNKEVEDSLSFLDYLDDKEANAKKELEKKEKEAAKAKSK